MVCYPGSGVSLVIRLHTSSAWIASRLLALELATDQELKLCSFGLVPNWNIHSHIGSVHDIDYAFLSSPLVLAFAIVACSTSNSMPHCS